MTINAAHALSMEEVAGSLEVGKYADLVVLSANPLSIDEGSIKDIVIEATLLSGELAYCAEASGLLCPQ